MYALIMTFILTFSYVISRQKKEYRKIFIIANGLVCITYIVWRFFTIPINTGTTSFILGSILFSAELLGLISYLNFNYLFTKKYKLELKTLDDFKEGYIPYIDVLICTYNEPLNLLEKTIAACTNLNYPIERIKIHVCDDGRRKELKDLCDSYDVNYITRNDNEGAKAGNINNALKYLEGDLFAVLDADMIPKDDFLLKTVGYFSNENMAFVQAPQVYYNQDMYQYNLSKDIPNEQDFFMREIQEARAARNAVLHVGTNALFRRSFVEEIGGYPTSSITEDMAVGMLLQAKGYDSVFVNEELVLGLSATTFSELVKQRDRWCRGNLQVLKHFNPLFSKGLTFGQKIAYIDGGIYWFTNLQKLIYIACPIIYLLTSIPIINAPIDMLLNIYLPHLLGQILIFNTLSSGNRKLRWSHFYDTSMAPHMSMSILKELLCLKTKFNVTSKEICHDKKHFQLSVAIPHIFILVFSVISWMVATPLVLNHKIQLSSYLLNMAWSIYNFIGVGVSIKVAYQKPIYRTSERVAINEDISVKCSYQSNKFDAKILDISEQGIGLKLKNKVDFRLGDEIAFKLLDTLFTCTISRSSNDLLGLKFKNMNIDQMKLLMSIFTENVKAHHKLNRMQ